MNFKIRDVGIFLLPGAILLLINLSNNLPGSYQKPTEREEGIAPSLYIGNNNYIQENITLVYKYRVEIETIPENQVYSIKKSGYNGLEVTRLGETYSYKVYEFTSDKILNTKEAYEYVLNNPGKCKLVTVPKPAKENIIDIYNDKLEDYLEDPEDNILYPDDIFDFQDD